MILSFHPCFAADENLLCAGRDPAPADIDAMRAAEAIILPQGCRKSLYDAARSAGRRVFPDYSQRFAYPGKTGQARLFETFQYPHPRTLIFPDTPSFFKLYGQPFGNLPLAFPLVLKYDWGGVGETVFLLRSHAALAQRLKTTEALEESGQRGFIIQELIPNADRILRGVIMHDTIYAYFRVAQPGMPFGVSLAAGAAIEPLTSADQIESVTHLLDRFRAQTGINLAGIDLIPGRTPDAPWLFLEINYFFGRKGLGGSERYYALLARAINRWLAFNDLPEFEQSA